MTSLSPGQIMLAAAIVFGVATAAQVIAPRLRIPALILLLPAGFVIGMIAPDLRVDAILGPAFPVAVDLIVAVILFQGGLDLSTAKLQDADHRVVRRLVRIGAPITWGAGTLAAYFLLDIDWSMALLLGALLIVSGPTVVTPILNFARPTARVRGILQWEGTILDPVGGLIAVVVFQVIQASGAQSLTDGVIDFTIGILIGVVAAIFGVVLFVIGGRLVGGNMLLGTQVLLGSVIVVAGLANFIAEGTGLIAALLMGLAAPRIAERFNTSLDAALPFFSTVVAIGIGVLFVSISGLVDPGSVGNILIPAIALSAILILIVRPLVATICTSRTSLSRGERTFIAAMDPRGIVAAATASSVGASLIAAKVPGAEQILPATFIVIAVTVTVYGLGAIPLAKALGLRDTSSEDAGPTASTTDP
jgi:NhaP-type Na+/H+ or K+/H+ antiporter